GAGAAVILASTHFGFPLSTTHVINGGVMGSGAAKRLSAVRWGVAGNIFVAWLLTLPAAAAIGGLTYGFTAIFGTGALGPILVALMALSLVAAAFARRGAPPSRRPADDCDDRPHRRTAADDPRLGGRRPRRHLRFLGCDLGRGS